MKILDLLLAFIFVLFAVLQYNDPDPLLWITFYLYVAAMCAFAAFNRYNRYVLWAGIAASVVWMMTLLPEVIDWVKLGAPNIAGEMKATEPYVEFTREFIGVGICLAVLIWQLFRSRKAFLDRSQKI